MKMRVLAAGLTLLLASASVVPSGGAPPGLAVGPSVFAAKKAAFLQRLFEALNATEAPPTPAPAPLPSWLDLLDDAPQPDDSADAPQALGRVPLAAASAPVDPSAARAQFLSALFGGLGLPPPAPKPTIVPPGFWSPFALAKPTIVPPDFWVPAGKPSPAALYRAKVASFLGALFQQANATAAPQPPAATRRNVRAVEGTPEAAEEGSAVERRGALGGPFGGPFGGPLGGPFGGAFGPFGAGKPFGPTVDPKFFMDKKTAFLSQLFASKAASTADASGGDANPAPAPSFGPFAPYGFAPTPKPTIVPPDFWSPFAALKAPSPAATAFADKKAKFLSTLLALKATTTPAPPPPPQEEDPAEDDEEADFDDFLQELAQRLTAPGGAALARRGLPPGSPDAALAQMAALKDAIVATANAIVLAQKEAAAQQPAFPFAKGPYAAMKKGGPPPGVFSKKGGPPPGELSQAFDSLAALERGASAPAPAPARPSRPARAAAALLQLLRRRRRRAGGGRRRGRQGCPQGQGRAGARGAQPAVRRAPGPVQPAARRRGAADGRRRRHPRPAGGRRPPPADQGARRLSAGAAAVLQAGEQEGDYAGDAVDDAAPGQDWPRRHHSHHSHH
ncbi:Uncharacterized protein GBIM_11651 [Gryllus bimaculatus]|nr:Uncharacterized protein GBIM_11651 [Gryllus bimaculatus]